MTPCSTMSPTLTPHAMSRRRAVGLVVAGAVGFASGLAVDRASGWAQTGTPAVEDAGYPLVEIVGKDFSFEMPAEIPGGLTQFTLHNEGAFTHHVIFVRLREGVTQAEIDAAASEQEYLPLLALGEPFGGPNAAPAGGSATAIVDLPAGDYLVFCVIGDAEGVLHYRHGMIAPLTVTPAPASRPAPAASQTITLRDYTFDGLPSELPAGRQVWQITNEGPETHELVVFRQLPGVTFEMVAESFGIAPQGTPVAGATMPPGPPFEDVGGVTLIGPGVTNWAVLDLEPGAYFANCFVLSPNRDHAPHFAFGMIQPFTVA
ncbi:MAG: hypothetical protein KC442_16735 [Thermomicrobiales bacterium]|nr:hypothetical protein [Thermomicrobiales bacterium]